jgi:hypothetical protein
MMVTRDDLLQVLMFVDDGDMGHLDGPPLE